MAKKTIPIWSVYGIPTFTVTINLSQMWVNIPVPWSIWVGIQEPKMTSFMSSTWWWRAICCILRVGKNPISYHKRPSTFLGLPSVRWYVCTFLPLKGVPSWKTPSGIQWIVPPVIWTEPCKAPSFGRSRRYGFCCCRNSPVECISEIES